MWGGGCEEECVTVRRYVCGVLGVEVWGGVFGVGVCVGRWVWGGGYRFGWVGVGR